ncbi:MAG: hypothetical protein K2X87_34895 [Gemmataceae bacterium]|nr:hypothetical protein [Gemmataceae bacterium]
MCKLLTILCGSLVVAGGVGYGLYVSHQGDCCDWCPTSAAAVSVEPGCDQSATCPYAATAAKATCPADGEECCPRAAAAVAAASDDSCPLVGGGTQCCPAGRADAGLQAVAGAALSAGGK